MGWTDQFHEVMLKSMKYSCQPVVDLSHISEPKGSGDGTAATLPCFIDQGLKPITCTIATAMRKTETIELRFGCLESRSPYSVGSTMTNRVRLDLPAAKFLEEALSRVLGALESDPTTGTLKS